MNKTTKSCKRGYLSLFFTVLGTFISGFAYAEYGVNMTQGVTEFSQTAYDLHMIVFWICVVIAVLVFGTMIYSMFAHRKSKGVEAAQFSHSTKAEVIWTIIPILILVSMAVPATKALMRMEAPKDEVQ